ncbi:hypothetical protein [Stenomitos frigidus]|uniref:Uncharacterized protein n=1 Tax=Stenomitos frigidus ULC18 TaxID=2107698 RepID=A0A2T1E261_9CYAN|nr:hypothetical protein [Stenomitos frigidus]PSB26829.1 hypothetical protein C7B82_18415 [Stenomitos frigidus ULC18]
MILIREIVQQALITGYLTIDAENQLRQLLRTKYDVNDLNAFMLLQQAAMSGSIRQESRDRAKNDHVMASMLVSRQE